MSIVRWTDQCSFGEHRWQHQAFSSQWLLENELQGRQARRRHAKLLSP